MTGMGVECRPIYCILRQTIARSARKRMSETKKQSV